MRGRNSGSAFIVAAALLCLFWSGCGREDRPAGEGKGASGRSRSERPRIALIMKARTNPFFHTMEVGAVRAAKKHDVELLVMSVDRETDFAKQGGPASVHFGK